MRKRNIAHNLGIVICLMAIIALAITAVWISKSFPFPKGKTTAWYEENPYLAHAMGGIDEMNYTNSLEAFESNYQKGFKVIEIDLLETSDGILVGRHSWDENDYDSYTQEAIPTSKQFLNNPVYGKYTSVDITKLLQLASEHPDVYFITDTKKTDLEANQQLFTQIIETAKSMDMLDVLREQFIIQFYTEEMYYLIMRMLAPENVLYTLYKLENEDYENAILFCSENRIPLVTIEFKNWNTKLQATADQYHVKTAVHTINDEKVAETLFQSGVTCIYTDFISPQTNF